MAEVHIIGQITQAKDFPKYSLFCKWYLQIGNNWRVVSGQQEGQTHVNSPEFEDSCKWSYPLDIHLATSGIEGWPKIYLQVYHLDLLGNSHLYGYGFITIPTTPGNHNLDCYTWRPFGSFRDRFVRFFLGGSLTVKNPDLIFSSRERYKLCTEAMGKVSFSLNVIFRSTTPKITQKISTTTQAPLKSSTICEEDCLNATNTTPSTSTESTQLNASKSVTSKPATLSVTKRKQNPKQDICLCDLQIDYCDLNCCCDEDCNEDEKKVFSHCSIEPTRYFDTRFCDYIGYANKTFLGDGWNVFQNGLFCVIRSNPPPTYLVQKHKPLESFEEAEFEKRNRYSWPSFASKIPSKNCSKTTKLGCPLYAVENNILDTFKIPTSLITNYCNKEQAVNYLVDAKSTCFVKINGTFNASKFSAASYFQNKFLVSNITRLNVSLTGLLVEQCPKNICIAIQAYRCDASNWEKCENITHNNRSVDYLKATCSRNSCENVVSRIKYEIQHNGTHGIVSVKVYLSLIRISIGSDLEQCFEVEFKWFNAGNHSKLLLSGNPGYLQGAPILTADLINTNTSEVTAQRNPDLSFLTLLDSKQRICVLNQNHYSFVQFGFNIYRKCRIISTLPLVEASFSSPKNVCRSIQKMIFNYWSLNVTNNTLKNRIVAQFGNSNVEKRNEWVSLLFKVDLNETIESVWGSFEDKNRTLICGNISTVQLIDIHYSRVDFDRVFNQNKILAAVLQLIGFRTLSLSVANKSFVNFNEWIRSEIMFYDITEEKKQKIANPPTLDISLPHDFFYPFVRIKNCACFSQSLYAFLIVFCHYCLYLL